LVDKNGPPHPAAAVVPQGRRLTTEDTGEERQEGDLIERIAGRLVKPGDDLGSMFGSLYVFHFFQLNSYVFFVLEKVIVQGQNAESIALGD
jgi:hypothetical protein